MFACVFVKLMHHACSMAMDAIPDELSRCSPEIFCFCFYEVLPFMCFPLENHCSHMNVLPKNENVNQAWVKVPLSHDSVSRSCFFKKWNWSIEEGLGACSLNCLCRNSLGILVAFWKCGLRFFQAESFVPQPKLTC